MKNNSFNNKKGGSINKKPQTFVITYPMDMSGVCGDKEYDVNTLIALLKEVPFEKISFPVSCAKSLVFEDDTKTGTTNVGYVSNVEYETNEDDGTEDAYIKCVIFQKNVSAIKKIACPYIFPKVRINKDGIVTVLISFEINNDEAEEDTTE